VSEAGRISDLSKAETRTALRAFNWNLACRGVFTTLCGGTTMFFTAFILSLGVAQEQMGNVAFVMSLACLLQLLAAPLLARVPGRKVLLLTIGTLEPLLFAGAVLGVPWLPLAWRLPVLFAAIFLATMAINLIQPFTDDWLATTIPPDLRGRYIGRRLQLFSVTVIVTTLVASHLLERTIGKTNTTGLGWLLVFGGLFGLLSILSLRRAAMPATATTAQFSWRDIPAVFRHRQFARLLVFIFLYNLPFSFACPYYQVYHLEVVQAKASMIGYMMNVYLVVKILTVSLLGRLADRWGARRLIYLVSVIYVLFFGVYATCQPGLAWVLVAAWGAVALADGAWGVVLTKLLYETVPDTPLRPAYFAVNNIVGVLFTGIGGMLAVPVLEAIRGVSLTVGPLHLGSFHLLYLGCTLLMIPCLFATRLLPVRTRPAPAAVPKPAPATAAGLPTS